MTVVATVPSYLRPHLLKHCVAPILESGLVHRVIVLHKSTKLGDIEPPWPGVEVINSDYLPVGHRFSKVLELEPNLETLISVDDEIILTPFQVRRIIRAAQVDTENAHGFRGISFAFEEPGTNRQLVVNRGQGGGAEVLWQVYAASRSVIERYSEVCKRLDIDPLAVTNGEDMILSYCSADCARILPIFVIGINEESASQDSAMCLREGELYVSQRRELLQRLRALRPEVRANVASCARLHRRGFFLKMFRSVNGECIPLTLAERQKIFVRASVQFYLWHTFSQRK